MTNVINDVQICNLALGHLGVTTRASNISSPRTKEERICASHYDYIRQGLLEAYPWSFAKTRTNLSASSEAPAFGWTYQSSEFPADFLILLGLCDTSGRLLVNTNRKYFEREGNRILTDLEPPYRILYIKNVEDVTKMPRLFVKMFVIGLAIDMYKDFGSNTTTVANLKADYEKVEAMAVSVNRRENPPLIVSESPYLQRRRV